MDPSQQAELDETRTGGAASAIPVTFTREELADALQLFQRGGQPLRFEVASEHELVRLFKSAEALRLKLHRAEIDAASLEVLVAAVPAAFIGSLPARDAAPIALRGREAPSRRFKPTPVCRILER